MSKRRQYEVTVAMTKHVEIKVWAEDEGDAEEKACDIVLKWEGVVDAEAVDVEESA